MKKISLIMLTLMSILNCQAQQTGIQFENALTWEQILSKAKEEHKYIFVDCYATWCEPCKWMDANIYPLKEVGDAYNKDFISVRMQMDQTASDNKETKKLYETADMLTDKYGINAYPTFLFLDSEGKAVHKISASMNAKDFVQLAVDARNPEKQYYTILKNFEPGKLDTTEEKSLAQLYAFSDNALAGKIAADYLSKIPPNNLGYKPTVFLMANLVDNPDISNIAMEYIKTHDLEKIHGFIDFLKERPRVKDWATGYIDTLNNQLLENQSSLDLVTIFYDEPKVKERVKNYLDGLSDQQLYTKINIGYLALASKTPEDKKGFDIFYKNSERVDLVVGQIGFARDQAEGEIRQGEFEPLLKAAKQNGISPNFDSIYTVITKKYNSYFAGNIITRGKPGWYQYLIHDKHQDQVWPQLISTQITLVERFRYDTVKSMSEYINDVSWEVYVHGNDPAQVDKAVHWMGLVVDRGNHYSDNTYYLYTDTYASLLYKAGQLNKALKWADIALKVATEHYNRGDVEYQQNKIAAMKRGERIWNQKELQ